MSAKIEINGVKKGFDTDAGRLPVVDGFTLSVADGEFVAIVGPSGCGKSTLMNIISGLTANARAISTRLSIPPDSSCG